MHLFSFSDNPRLTPVGKLISHKTLS